MSYTPVRTRRDRDWFYRPPYLDETGCPGDLLRAAPMTARLLPGVALPARAWRVLYRSTTATGEPIAVSGVVLVPNTPNPPTTRSLLGFAPGTQGLARSATVSRLLELGLEYEAGFLSAAVRRGWVVAVTDYPGLGTPGVHPYVVGKANGRALLDIMRAARHLPEAELDPEGPAAIYGYSEGGNSAAWAAQLQPGYATEVRLKAVAVGAAPVDFPELIADLDGGLFSFLLLYAGLGLNSAYPELRFQDYLNRGGRLAAAVLRHTHILAAITLGLLLPKKRQRYLSADPFATPDWIIQLRENSLGHLPPAAPALIGIGRQDQVIPYRQAELLLRRWGDLGADVREHPIRFGEHITAAPQFAKAGFAFLSEHLSRSESSTPFREREAG
ncbi:lipase family protein [Mycobacteroides immunogenum]|uniref:lipase family protein n=1 Tax=Mycobacteroides immunogenum TaxID=83262 RepID=UPI0025B78E1E|nr:lipase family protein [Mycobacteroides immunogenum]WJR36059.1 lipase family protein [Mycobacteroides immunogenum]